VTLEDNVVCMRRISMPIVRVIKESRLMPRATLAKERRKYEF
jgi:hypothetical protein